VLVVGSSLMVYSGYRFCVAAREQNKPILSINLGRTRADADMRFKLSMDCGDALTALADRLCA
jgi:NAD-dependent SIR2 family protein deacetylase